MKCPTRAQQTEKAYNAAASLYWIAYLLSGHSELSLALTLEVIDSEAWAEGVTSSKKLAELRRAVIERTVAAMREELARSALQTRSLSVVSAHLETCFVVPDMNKLEIERALLAVDSFPRCVLVLAVFEKFPVERVSILLQSDRQSVLHARTVGLLDFIRHLPRLEARTAVPSGGPATKNQKTTALPRVSREHLAAMEVRKSSKGESTFRR